MADPATHHRRNRSGSSTDEFWQRTFQVHAVELRRALRSDHTRTGGAGLDLGSPNVRVDSVPDDGSGSFWKVAHYSDITVVLGKVQRGDTIWTRDPQIATQTVVILTRRGVMRMLGGDYLVNRPNFAVLLPGEEPVTFAVDADGTEFVLCRFPSPLVSDIPVAARDHQNDADVDGSLVDPIFHFLATTVRQPVDTIGGRASRHSIGEVLRILIRLATDTTEAELSVFERAQEAIRADISNPKLNETMLASRLRVSPKQLLAEYRAHGTTVARELRRERRAQLSRLLAENPTAHPVALGFSVGFSSKSTIYRVLAELAE